MRRYIKLSELGHIPTEPNKFERFTREEMEAARAAMVERGVRWDNWTGKLYTTRDGCIEEPCHPADHRPHETEEQVMRWEFSRQIGNAASRVRRGYTAY